MFGVVRAPRVYEHIVAQIERAIYEGRLAHGDKLPPERQLVREFAASRVAAREALRALEHRGLVEVRQGSAGGYFIREADDTPAGREPPTLCPLDRGARAPAAHEVRRAARRSEPTPADDAEIFAAHLGIHAAIARRDGEAARAAMHAHILDVERRLDVTVVARAAS